MTVRYLVDTDVAVEILRKRDKAVRRRLRDTEPVGLSSITLYELRYGADKSNDPPHNHLAIDELTMVADIVDFDAAAAQHASAIRAELSRLGNLIGPYDLLIAGSARSQTLTLVTRNDREFKRVPGLSVERW